MAKLTMNDLLIVPFLAVLIALESDKHEKYI
jgi:hypothetical protein